MARSGSWEVGMRKGVAAMVWLGWLGSACPAFASGPPPASQVDPFVARPRVVVLTDIANEPDDQMSLVRFLVYSNQFHTAGPNWPTFLKFAEAYIQSVAP